jgi:RHS repeat-associated protein
MQNHLKHPEFSPAVCSAWDKGYRYGYQGSEKDNDVSGNGNSYTTEFRQLDVRLGRWFSRDPLFKEFSSQSPYISMNNSPISIIDIFGLKGDWHWDKGDNNEKILVADKGDTKSSLSDFLESSRNTEILSIEEKQKILDKVDKLQHESYTFSNQTITEGSKINVSTEVFSEIKIFIGLTNGITPYEKYGGHVGLGYIGNVYHWYYNDLKVYKTNNPLKVYPGKIHVVSEKKYNEVESNHGDGNDFYFSIYLSAHQMHSLNNTLSEYKDGENTDGVEAPMALYTFRSGDNFRRCTSFIYFNLLDKSGIDLGLKKKRIKKRKTFHPHAFYHYLIESGYSPNLIIR